MSKVDLSNMQTDFSGLRPEDAIRRIQSYLWQLNEKLQYELTHIDEDNMAVNNTPTVYAAGSQERESGSQSAADSATLKQVKAMAEDALRIAQQQEAEIKKRMLSDTAYWLIGRLTNEYRAHVHQITIDGGGNISMGPPVGTATNPNIADTAFFQNAVSAARPDTGNPPTMVLTSSDMTALSNGGSVSKNIIVRGIDGYGVVLPVNVMAIGV